MKLKGLTDIIGSFFFFLLSSDELYLSHTQLYRV